MWAQQVNDTIDSIDFYVQLLEYQTIKHTHSVKCAQCEMRIDLGQKRLGMLTNLAVVSFFTICPSRSILIILNILIASEYVHVMQVDALISMVQNV